MRWAGHVARVMRREMHTELWWGNMKERDRLNTKEDNIKTGV